MQVENRAIRIGLLLDVGLCSVVSLLQVVMHQPNLAIVYTVARYVVSFFAYLVTARIAPARKVQHCLIVWALSTMIGFGVYGITVGLIEGQMQVWELVIRWGTLLGVLLHVLTVFSAVAVDRLTGRKRTA
jgi:hypothetical protein